MGRRIALLTCLLYIFLPASSQAAAIALGPQTHRVAVLAYAEVADGTASYADIRAGRVAFVPFAQYKPHGSPASMWVRFALASAESHDRRRWLLALPRDFESADLYRAGVAQPRADVYVPAFRILDRDFSGAPLYLHVRYYADVPLLIRVIDEHDFFTWSEPYRLVEGAFIGVLAAVALFNMFVFGIMRDRSAVLYVLYIVTMIVNELVTTGIGDEYLWPGIALSARFGGYATNFAAFAAFLIFARSFLRTREEAPRWDRALITAFAVYAVVQIAEVFFPGGNAFLPALLLVEFGAMLVTASAGVFRLRSGYQPARFFVVAFVPSMVGVLANLYYDAFVPAGNWFLAANGVELGTMLQAAILSFSIVDRMRILEREALVDPLTSLPNRMHFTQELTDAIERAGREQRAVGVLFVDLDRFKRINDQYGHRFGDEVLRTVGKRLCARVRKNDIVARLGGDEFAVILENAGSVQLVERVAEQVAHLLDDPVVIDGKHMPIGISVGRALYPDDGRTMDDLLHAADLRMYEMKQAQTAAV